MGLALASILGPGPAPAREGSERTMWGFPFTAAVAAPLHVFEAGVYYPIGEAAVIAGEGLLHEEGTEPSADRRAVLVVCFDEQDRCSMSSLTVTSLTVASSGEAELVATDDAATIHLWWTPLQALTPLDGEEICERGVVGGWTIKIGAYFLGTQQASPAGAWDATALGTYGEWTLRSPGDLCTRSARLTHGIMDVGWEA